MSKYVYVYVEEEGVHNTNPASGGGDRGDRGSKWMREVDHVIFEIPEYLSVANDFY